MTFEFSPGWEYNADQIAANVSRMETAGHIVGFSAASPALSGNWNRLVSRGVTGVFAQDSEEKLRKSVGLSRWRLNNLQARGSCVMQGTERAAEDSHNAAVARGEYVGGYTLFAGEPGYAWCRRQFNWGSTHRFGCTCRKCPDGLSGSNFAEYLATKGVIKRGVYGSYDLTQPQEHYAIDWNNSGVPDEVLTPGVGHTFNAHRCHSPEEFADAISAEYFGAVCLPEIFDGSSRDGEFILPSNTGGQMGHCTEVSGVFLDDRGRTAFMVQQSWPESATNYPKILTQWQGPPKELRPAAYPIRASQIERFLNQAELWVFGVKKGNTFR